MRSSGISSSSSSSPLSMVPKKERGEKNFRVLSAPVFVEAYGNLNLFFVKFLA
jgi:hypothetical protein